MLCYSVVKQLFSRALHSSTCPFLSSSAVAAMVFCMTVFVWFLVPETKGVPLEEV